MSWRRRRATKSWPGGSEAARLLLIKTMKYKCTYNYCGICGYVPRTRLDEPNRAPVRWWDPDDGWKIGSLCRWCHDEVSSVQPKPTDYAFATTNGVCDDCNTDEDPLIALG